MEPSAKRGDASAQCQLALVVKQPLIPGPIPPSPALWLHRGPRSQTSVGMRLPECHPRSPTGCRHGGVLPLPGPRAAAGVCSAPISRQHRKLCLRYNCELGRFRFQTHLRTCSKTGCWQRASLNLVVALIVSTVSSKSCAVQCSRLSRQCRGSCTAKSPKAWDCCPGGFARCPLPASSELSSTWRVQCAAFT